MWEYNKQIEHIKEEQYIMYSIKTYQQLWHLLQTVKKRNQNIKYWKPATCSISKGGGLMDKIYI